MATFQVVSREEWGAKDPKYTEPLSPPLEVVIFHCAGKRKCHDRESCTKVLQKMQQKHLRYGLPDILYNFLIGGDGAVYEGRGWEATATKHPETKLDCKVLDVAYIGPYKIPGRMPPENMMEAAANLVNLGRMKKVLQEDCLRSDLDLQAGDSDNELLGSDATPSESDPEDVVDQKDDLENENIDEGSQPGMKDVLDTQDEKSKKDYRKNKGGIDPADVFNPEEDDIPYEM